ncbi:MAG: mechanosensitive ion channel family protein [Candidatus Cloacimonadaceae bacterium]|nr:mechanosensitive ion channel family protein [Candidatus Cloacimonadaceae bacterium]MDP3113220.1 mechanosensitive ion channel family protein [Candidatus Cloacimonadaceae bacterium]
MRQFATPERITLAIRVILIIAIGIPLLGLIRRMIRKLVKDRLSPQSEQLIMRAVLYTGILILLISLLNEFGFKLTALLGAAGVFGIAIGFASQTSVSNIICGIFLISEKPFVVGDFIQVGSTIGMVDSFDLLSIKLKTSDNRFVRVPNETMIKTEVINITRFPRRRANINVCVAYKEDLKKVIGILKKIAESEPLALQDTPPVINVESFGDSGIGILYGVWGKTEELILLKTSLMIGIKEQFEAEGIEIPTLFSRSLPTKNLNP